jgi:hypothetical protein
LAASSSATTINSRRRSWTSAQGKTNFIDPAASLSVTSDHNWYDTLSGRLGYVMGPLMLYGKAGARLDECRLPCKGEWNVIEIS